MDAVILIIVIGVAAVVAFDFTNGFHDASNMIATLVASRAMTPAHAVSLVGIFTFLGPNLGGTAVADTIGASERPRAVRWAKAQEIGVTWVLTLPGACALGAGAYALLAGAQALL